MDRDVIDAIRQHAVNRITKNDTTKLDLSGRNLSGTDFYGELLANVNFSGCDLSFCDFSMADLRAANLENANLTGAKLYTAELLFAKMNGCVLKGAHLPPFGRCPEVGTFEAFVNFCGVNAEVMVPAAAARTSSLVDRMPRAQGVIVLSIDGDNSDEASMEWIGKVVHVGDYVDFREIFIDDIRVSTWWDTGIPLDMQEWTCNSNGDARHRECK